MKKLKLADIDLTIFDEGGAAAAAPAGGEGGSPAAGAENTPGVAPQDVDVTKVQYGKPAEEPPAGEEKPAAGKADPPQLTPEQRTEQFNNLIKGDYKDLFGAEVQRIINDRFKSYKQLESQVGELSPIFDILKEKYEAKDTKELLSKIESETLEDLAYKNGMTKEQFQEVMKLRRENAELKQVKDTIEEERTVNERVKKWQDEAAELKAGQYPDFDLAKATENKDFMDLLKAGIPVKAAYEASHIDEILNNAKKTTAQTVAQSVTDNIQARKSRIPENGARPAPGAIIKSDVTKLTAADRAEIARRAARGEEIKF